MNIILIGAPGAGKGTIANQLKEKYHFKHISTGDILRKEINSNSLLGQEVKNILATGKLVSDDIMVDIIKKNVADKEQSYILDGFPRTKKQAEALVTIMKIDHVLSVSLSDEEALVRLLNRRDDKGEKRNDDNEEVIKNRLKVFHQEIDPLINYYLEQKIIITIDGRGSMEEVFAKVVASLNLN